MTSQATPHAATSGIIPLLCQSRATLLLSLFLFVLSICCCSINAQPYRGYYTQKQCKDTQTGRDLLVGDFFTRPEHCIRVQCLGTLQLWEDNCLVPHNLKGDCTQVAPKDINADYPKCCPLYECKTYEERSQGKIEQTNTYDHYGNLRKTHLIELIAVIDNRPGAEVGPRRQYNL